VRAPAGQGGEVTQCGFGQCKQHSPHTVDGNTTCNTHGLSIGASKLAWCWQAHPNGKLCALQATLHAMPTASELYDTERD
jgi:hypothetical protein